VLKRKIVEKKPEVVEIMESNLEKENTFGSEPFVNTVDSSHLGLSQQLKNTLQSSELLSISEIEAKLS